MCRYRVNAVLLLQYILKLRFPANKSISTFLEALHRLENSSIVLWCSETLKFLLVQLSQITVNDNKFFFLHADRQFSLIRFVRSMDLKIYQKPSFLWDSLRSDQGFPVHLQDEEIFVKSNSFMLLVLIRTLGKSQRYFGLSVFN